MLIGRSLFRRINKQEFHQPLLSRLHLIPILYYNKWMLESFNNNNRRDCWAFTSNNTSLTLWLSLTFLVSNFMAVWILFLQTTTNNRLLILERWFNLHTDGSWSLWLINSKIDMNNHCIDEMPERYKYLSFPLPAYTFKTAVIQNNNIPSFFDQIY